MRSRLIPALLSIFGFGCGRPDISRVTPAPQSLTPSFSSFLLPNTFLLPGVRQSANSKAFGMSETCRRMRRKNRMRRLGIAGSRI